MGEREEREARGEELEMHLMGSFRGLWMDVERVLHMLLRILTIVGLTF